MNTDYLVEIHNYMLENEKKLKKIMEELQLNLETITFNEDGSLSNDFDSLSPYYSSAKESADVFRSYIIGNEIKELQVDKKAYEEKKKYDKELLTIATQLLREEQMAIRRKDKEIQDLNIAFLSSMDEKQERDAMSLEEKRLERDTLVERVEYFKSEIMKLNSSINGYNEHIALNNSEIKNLREEHATLIKRRTNRSEYLDLDKIKKDLSSLSSVVESLEIVEDQINVLIKGEKNKILEQKKEVPTPKETPRGRGVYEADEEYNKYLSEYYKENSKDKEASKRIDETQDVSERTDLSVEMPFPVEEHALITTPESKPNEWKMDGFKLDFIEKFGYIPDKDERNLNANYNGDYSRLISHPKDKKETMINKVVIKIREISSSVVEKIKQTSNKTFKSREPVVEDSLIIPITEYRVR